jgi:hypothetical protein
MAVFLRTIPSNTAIPSGVVGSTGDRKRRRLFDLKNVFVKGGLETTTSPGIPHICRFVAHVALNRFGLEPKGREREGGRNLRKKVSLKGRIFHPASFSYRQCL